MVIQDMLCDKTNRLRNTNYHTQTHAQMHIDKDTHIL